MRKPHLPGQGRKQCEPKSKDVEYPEHTYRLAPTSWQDDLGTLRLLEMRVKRSESDDKRRSEYIEQFWKSLTESTSPKGSLRKNAREPAAGYRLRAASSLSDNRGSDGAGTYRLRTS